MSYVTNSDVEKRLGTAAYIELTDDARTGSADLARVEESRLGAIGEANSYLATRFAVPVDLTGNAELAAVLKSFVLDLVEYRLHCRRPPVPVDVVRRRSEAVTWFRGVADGTVQLPLVTPLPADASRSPLAEVIGAERVFRRSDIEES